MKRKKLFIASIIALSLIAVALLRLGPAFAGESAPRFSVALGVGHNVYNLAYEVPIAVSVTNDSTDGTTGAFPSFSTGTLGLMISSDGREFREYIAPGWGARDIPKSKEDVFAVGDRIDVAASVLYNSPARTSHLTPLYADRLNRSRAAGYFAFPAVGTYWVKAVYRSPGAVFESEAAIVEISGTALGDEDIWRRVAEDRATAYFLATGDVPYPPSTPERTAFVESVQSLTSEYRSSPIAERLGVRLDKWLQDQVYIERIKAEAARE